MSPVGQNGHGFHSLMPSVSQVCRLITLTLDPPSMIVPGSSLLFMMTIIAELLMSTTTNPFSGFEKNVDDSSGLCGDNIGINPTVNLGTNCKSLP